ncbi:MAG: hypothetical protein QG621_95 [Patescibacteria group bacterium]|nr:hypothetical protein [Patescibacteria group bacterium]
MVFLQKEFANETDRGAVLVTASLLENTLTNLLKKFFTPSCSSEDELIDVPNAPLSNFSAKIKICERLGIISPRLGRDLHLIRKIRNEFAHNIHGSSLESGRIKDLLTNLVSTSGIVDNHKEVPGFPTGARGQFLKVVNIMLYHLNGLIENSSFVSPCQPATEEWLYSWVYQKSESTTLIPSHQASKDIPINTGTQSLS